MRLGEREWATRVEDDERESGEPQCFTLDVARKWVCLLAVDPPTHFLAGADGGSAERSLAAGCRDSSEALCGAPRPCAGAAVCSPVFSPLTGKAIGLKTREHALSLSPSPLPKTLIVNGEMRWSRRMGHSETSHSDGITLCHRASPHH